MKTINVTFEDKEYESLKDVKGNLNWHDFILILVKENIRNDT